MFLPNWFWFILEWWPLAIGVLLGVVGQVLWSFVK